MKMRTGELGWAVAGLRSALVFTLLVTCALGGMFFLEDSAALLFVAFWLTGIALILGFGLIRKSSGISPPTVLQADARMHPSLQAALAPATLACLYILHLGLGPASVQATILSAVFWLFAAGYAAALQAAACGGTAVRFLESGWLLTTGLLALASLAVVYGCLPWSGAILRTADREVAAAGARLGGLLQYPNTFGAVMGAALLERLTALAALPRQAFTRAGRWQGQQAGALAPVFALCLLLTESRGAFAALAAAWAIAALLLRRGERLRFALHSAAALGAGALLAAPLLRAGLAPPALQGLAALAAALGGWAAATAALAAAGPRALRLITGKRCAAGVAALAAAAGLLALAAARPGALQALPQRLTGAATLLARGDMYADALRVIGGAPWLGQGGDTWRSVYRSVQSSPYTGSEVHSGYLDLLMDLGLAGVLVLLAWIIPALRSAFRSRCRLLPSVLLLLLHSLIDFDLSYGLVWLLLIWLFRWAKAGAPITSAQETSSPLHSSPPHSSPPQRWRRQLTHPFLHRLVLLTHFRGLRFFRVLLPGAAALALLCAAVLCLGQAESLRRERLALAIEAQYPQEAEKLLRQASTLAPARPRLYLALAARSDAEEAAVWLQHGLRYERAQPELELALGKLLAERGDLAALEHLRRATELNRYSNTTWVTAMSEASRLATMKMADRTAERESQQQAAWQVLAAGAELYARYTELTAGGPWRRNDLNFGGEETVIKLGEQLRRMRESLPALRMSPVSESDCQLDPY
ncbi:tetratricopeptide repeat protein [Paenibacillus antibioticophila]|nr:O-antigen ligase family protein [Paenibacillus antibioticophila]